MRAHKAYISAVNTIFSGIAILGLTFLTPALMGQAENRLDVGLQQWDLEMLGQVTFTTASLNPSDIKAVPSSITQISRSMIENSGARSLYDLLLIYVPSLETVQSGTWGQEMNLRGNDGGILVLLNGIPYNMQARIRDKGVTSSMLGDIEEIEIIRGPGSVLYGSGALFGVINIKTFSGKHVEEQSIKYRTGFIEKFNSLEYKGAHQFDSNRSLFWFLGVDYYEGSSPEDSPAYGSYNYSSDLRTGVPLETAIGNNYGSYRDHPRYKVHVQYDSDDDQFWMHYERGGETTFAPFFPRTRANTPPYDSPLYVRGIESQNLTFNADFTRPLTERGTLLYSLSYDLFEWVHYQPDRGVLDNVYKSGREDRFFMPVHYQLDWSDHQKLTIGYEYMLTRFGRNLLMTDVPATYESNPANEPEANSWRVNRHALLGEYQHFFTDRWIATLGARADYHEYAHHPLVAYKTSLVYLLDNWQYKFNYNHSEQRTEETDLRKGYEQGVKADTFPSIDQLEFMIQNQPTDQWNLAATSYYMARKVFSFDRTSWQQEPNGELETAGLDLELSYRGEEWTTMLSHTYTHLLNYRLEDNSTVYQSITAEPYGESNAVAETSPHITKLHVRYQPTKLFSTYASLLYFWPKQGSKDLSEYNYEGLYFVNGNISDGTNDDAFDESVFLNLGLKYTTSKALTFSLDFHNIMGWVDEKYNKVNQRLRSSIYRIRSPGISASMEWKF